MAANAPDEALTDLLLSLFTADELRRFLRHGPRGDVLVADLPGATASARAQAHEAVEMLRRDGGLDDAFFDRLVAERPRRASDVRKVELRFSVPPADPDLAILGFVRAVLDRPAFRGPFAWQTNHLPHADALRLVIKALSAGVLHDRRGAELRRVAPVAEVHRDSWRRELTEVTRSIKDLSNLISALEQGGGSVADALALIDSTRDAVIRRVNAVFSEAGLDALPLPSAFRDYEATREDGDFDSPPGPQHAPSPAEPTVNRPPKVFISYSWDSTEHKAWVKALATRLRGDGVHVLLDQWEVAPGDQLPQFMESAVRDSDFVLLVCTPAFKAKADGRKGGVGYEGHIITAEVYTGADPRKYVPLLRDGEWRESAPSYLLGKAYSDLRGTPYGEEPYRLVVEHVHDDREPVPPVQPYVRRNNGLNPQ